MIKKNYLGKFITVEGIEGVGKSTAVSFLQKYLKAQHIDLVVTREPGGTEIGEAIRNVLLKKYEHEKMADDTELLLMFASRAQHLHGKIIPALQQGRWILSDRFTDASYAYQGGGRKIPTVRISALEKWLQGSMRPDLTLVLSAPVALALERIAARKALDRIEQEKKSFFSRVQKAYLERAKADPQRYKIIDASLPLKAVQQQLQSILDDFIQQHKSH